MENDVKLVIFDLDGTLIHLPIRYDELKREISGILGVNRVDSVLNALSKARDEAKRKIFNAWDRLELEAFSRMRKIDEGIEIYNSVHGKFKCLVTLQGRRVVEKILREIDLSFDYVVTREDGLDRSEQIKIVIEKFGVNPRDTLIVGDRESDKEAAKKVGCKFILIRKKGESSRDEAYGKESYS